jgi:hypothetical protein
VDGTDHFVAAERSDHAFDLPPVTETRDVAIVAASLGTRRGLEAGVVAEPLDQIGGIGERYASMDERSVHVRALNTTTVERLRMSIVNSSLTTFGLAFASSLGMGA